MSSSKGVLVTGGAGYVGSHVVRELEREGLRVVALDDLSSGHRAALGKTRLAVGDFADPQMLDELLGGGGIGYVVHMAAFCEVGESMRDPLGYYQNNVERSLRLLDAARRHGVRGFVFSSSAAVYGEPRSTPVPEDHPTAPTNPYGETKLVFERALDWCRRAHGVRYTALRYFNAAGAHPDGDIGEDHATETHLIPRLLLGCLAGGGVVPVYGDDYPTRDGTCVRDYVHVVDLARAHVLALSAMDEGRIEGESLNLGNGDGFTVREVIDAVGRVTGSPPGIRVADRRHGDPAVLVADAARAGRVLGWKPRHPTLEEIVDSAWNWHRRHPDGYGDRSPS